MLSLNRTRLYHFLVATGLSLGCGAPAHASPAPPAQAPPAASPQGFSVSQAAPKCGPNYATKCGPPSKPQPTTKCGMATARCGPPTTSPNALAATSVLVLQSTEYHGLTIRAIVGRQETGHFLAIEGIERGMTEGDDDILAFQKFVDLQAEMGNVVFVTPHAFKGDTLPFTLRDASGSAKTCQLTNTSTSPQLQCVIAHGRG